MDTEQFEKDLVFRYAELEMRERIENKKIETDERVRLAVANIAANGSQ